MIPEGSSWASQDPGRLGEELGAERVEAHHRIGSTNDRASELVRAGAPAWTVVVADEQTRGRGRRGKPWVSDAGAGLWMSIVLPTLEAGGALPLLVGLACAEAIETLAPEVHVGIKWPNDLMIGGRKVGGILCEAVGGAVVVGIGINVARPPGQLDAPGSATALEVEADSTLSQKDLASHIVECLRARLSEATPREVALADLSHRDVLRGVVVDTDQEGRGRASGIDATGALRLSRSDGSEVRVVSGGLRLSPTDS